MNGQGIGLENNLSCRISEVGISYYESRIPSLMDGRSQRPGRSDVTFARMLKITKRWQEIDRGLSAFAQAICADAKKIETMSSDDTRNNVAHPILNILLRR